MTIDAQRLTDWLEHWAEATPDATAVEDSAGNRATYAELDRLARRIASRLHALGVRRGDRVGVSMPKCVNSVASIYGALKAGAVYVPTDYSSPPDRNRYIYGACDAKVICTDEKRAPTYGEGETSGIPLLVFPGEGPSGVGSPALDEGDEAWESGDKPGLNDLAYILYTSGSTGVPKGVMHTHASSISFVQWAASELKPTSNDRFSSHAPFHFDLSILDLYVPATAGAAIVIVGENLGKSPHELAGYMEERKLTVWYSVPSILALLVQFGKLEEKDFSSLRHVCFAGEVFPIKHFRDLTALWPDKEYWNLYGPTETNVCTFHHVVKPRDFERTTPLPIGLPCSNVRAKVVDEAFNDVTPGEEGVLYIHCSGPTMVGYFGDDERTAASIHTDGDGDRWYSTGDVVIEGDGGELTFVGRRDRMVKRHGYRIELGEIEAGLYKHPQIDEAAAVAIETPAGTSITAFLSPAEGQKLSIIALKGHCAKALPSYMNPDKFTVLDRLPRTSTDKINYPELKKMATSG